MVIQEADKRLIAAAARRIRFSRVMMAALALNALAMSIVAILLGVYLGKTVLNEQWLQSAPVIPIQTNREALIVPAVTGAIAGFGVSVLAAVYALSMLVSLRSQLRQDALLVTMADAVSRPEQQ